MKAFPHFVFAFLFFCLAPGFTLAQQLQCNPCSHAFGKVQVGSSVSFSIQLSNTGTTTLRITSKSLTGSEFSFGTFPVPVRIKAGASVELPIVFAPTAAGHTSGVITLVSTAENPTLCMDLAGNGAYPLAVTPATLSFGNVTVGSSASLQATLTASNAAVTISSDGSTNSEFAILGLTLPVTIAAGQSVAATIQFTPSAAGAATGQATFTSNAVNSPTVEQLTGTGVAPANPQLAVSPATLSFGNVTVGSSASLQATLTASNAAVTISSDQSTNSEFAILELTLPATIAAGQSAQVTIQFTPSAAGAATGQAGFTSNAVNSPTVEQLTGTGVAQVSHSVALTWDAGSGDPVGYNVYRGTANGGPYEMINTALEATTNYTDTTVVCGTTYYYVATEVNAEGQESGYSNVGQAVIPPS
jgi:hypothetical protein